jgi:hypothetical protein
MPAHRTPRAKAAISGADTKHPGRFKDRQAPKKTRPVGPPYKAMSAAERAAWREFVTELPWLHSGHRPLLLLACRWMAKLQDPTADFGVSATQALSSILSKLGATPVDESKVEHGGGDDEDPTDEFFH